MALPDNVQMFTGTEQIGPKHFIQLFGRDAYCRLKPGAFVRHGHRKSIKPRVAQLVSIALRMDAKAAQVKP